MEKTKTKLISWQKPMRRMLFALLPLMLASVYFFGWRALLVVLFVNAVGFICEYLFLNKSGKPVTSAVFVTGVLYALSLPPTIPLWIAGIGIIFGVVFAKMAFGGFGKNVFNPAIAARAFIYITFPNFVNTPDKFVAPFSGMWGGFTAYAADTATGATPLAILKDGGSVSTIKLFLGNISGSLGETSALLIMVGAAYLIITKTANFRIIVSGVLSFIIMQTLFWLLKVKNSPDPLSAALAGSFLFGIVFMATDPVSASQRTDGGRWIYGSFIGMMIVLIRTFSVWVEAVTFAILLANMFAPLLNYALESRQKPQAGASP